MTSLRILHVVPYYEHAWAYGGIPRLATTITRALARRGHDVTVCTTDARTQSSRVRSGQTDDVPGMPRVRVFPNISNRLAYHFQFFTPRGLHSHLRASAGQYDVAHLHACHNLPVVFASSALAGAGVPYVVHPNGTAPPIERRIIAKRVFAATAARHLFRRAGRVLAVTEVEERHLLSLGVPDHRISIVPNPIDVEEFHPLPARRTFRDAQRLGQRRMVLFLGKLTPRKGVDVLLRAFAVLPDADSVLVIAGNDMGSGAALERLAGELGISNRVRWAGLLEADARLAALAAADVVAYPSRDEIFGLVPLEALLCGTPVIVCNDSGCGEVIRTIGGGEIVAYGDVAGLARALQGILGALPEWRQRATAASVQARQRFAADRVCDRLESVYREVIDSRRLDRRSA